MEDTLRVRDIVSDSCDLSLNPCFNGRYSQRNEDDVDLEAAFVLILVLMEDTLRDHDCKRFEVEVLILVLMEDTLRV